MGCIETMKHQKINRTNLVTYLFYNTCAQNFGENGWADQMGKNCPHAQSYVFWWRHGVLKRRVITVIVRHRQSSYLDVVRIGNRKIKMSVSKDEGENTTWKTQKNRSTDLRRDKVCSCRWGEKSSMEKGRNRGIRKGVYIALIRKSDVPVSTEHITTMNMKWSPKPTYYYLKYNTR